MKCDLRREMKGEMKRGPSAALVSPLRDFASTILRRISTPWQEHQVGRFLGILEQRVARRPYPRTHGQPTRKIGDLHGANGYRKVRR